MEDCVVNLRNEPRLRAAFEHDHIHNNTVLIDRRTAWGNPFKLGQDGNPDTVIALYRADLWHRIRAGEIDLQELAELDGCWLACTSVRSPVTATSSRAPRGGPPTGSAPRPDRRHSKGRFPTRSGTAVVSFPTSPGSKEKLRGR